MENITAEYDDTEPSATTIDLRFFLSRIFYPGLLVWGTIGNALCLRVLLSKKFFKNSTCQYLAILAVIDILFIVMRSSKHVYRLFRDNSIFNTSPWICRILTFSSSALAHMASWILVIVSFDRYLIVTSRYRRRGSAVNRVFCSTSVLIAVVALCNLYYFFILGNRINMAPARPTDTLDPPSNETQPVDTHPSSNTASDESLTGTKPGIFFCIPATGYDFFFGVYIPIFDILLVAVIPFFLLCFTNIGIIIYTMRTNRRMRQHRKRSHRRHQRLTIMLLSVTLAFIGLTCPSVIFICVNKIIYFRHILQGRSEGNGLVHVLGYKQPYKVQIMVDICEALWYAKHAMNFILYTMSGQDFRREFTKLFTQCFHTRASMLNKLIDRTDTLDGPEMDSHITDISLTTNTSVRKKSKKAISYNRDTSAVVVLINSKLPPLHTQSD